MRGLRHLLRRFSARAPHCAAPTRPSPAVSLVAVAVCAVLVVSELHAYFAPRMREHVVVDPVMEDRLRINFDITFHALSCAEANIDAMDVAGEQQNGLDHDISKTRLSPSGVAIGSAFAHRMDEEAATASSATPLPAGYCGSCYGAEARPGQCCNTCDDVRNAYAERGWEMNKVTHECEQCLRERRFPEIEAKEGEGCRLTGFMRVNKVAGNFHVAMGETHSRGAGHIHQFNPTQLQRYNVTHTVHSLSFGEPFPGQRNPLDGVTRGVSDGGGSGVWMHYIKVVPTVYAGSAETTSPAAAVAALLSAQPSPSAAAPGAVPGGRGRNPLLPGGAVSTNQYSVTSQYRQALGPGGRMTALPGVFFVYDISP